MSLDKIRSLAQSDQFLKIKSILKYIFGMKFLERIKGTKTRLIVKVLIGLEMVALFLYVLNGIFYDFGNILTFHRRVWLNLLSTITVKQTIIWSMPIILTAIGAAYNERSGVINIGLEGIMIWGAWSAVFFTSITGNPWLGVLGAIFVGFLVALLHAVFTITFKAEQIITGVAINLLALGLTGMLTTLIWQPGRSNPVGRLDPIDFYSIPVLGNILGFIRFRNYFQVPVIGTILKYIPDPIDAFSGHTGLVYIGIIIIPLAHFFLFHTTIGLRIRVIGEHPQAAATAGIPVRKYQYFAVILSGILSSLGGAMISLRLGLFADNMIKGQGFIALVAMIFGKWTVIGSVFASLLFGYFIYISIVLPISGTLSNKVPPPIINMIPYVIAIVALAGYIGRARPPKAVGKPYDPSEE